VHYEAGVPGKLGLVKGSHNEMPTHHTFARRACAILSSD
jgi:hypothetical protein